MEQKEATFGAGCFWGVEDAFCKVPGIIETEVGFMGGHVPDVSYEKVCDGSTGHAEVVHVTYDPQKVSYKELLKVFWKVHDPTQYHRQGPDVGSQYRSAIFYYDDEQKREAEESVGKLEASGNYTSEIVTEIEKAGPFYRAEEYHQKYFQKQGGGTCHV
ncbi:peptide-methionine (S)-S-oxide reductase [bacterium]|nr:peptide-methionine (S)-S-oxide reductase [bacterium]|tara:strand:+ start:5263 stop:5739 length:477 start_codon:yes stop_codon:yes gene_type:complete